ncbi:IS200/IS605 family transposase [Halomarina pelagica]|uniref:IS200/IS605 family transposase n=1 Tax=Halomarina pelagica TaxID=2961599 RepID=UPI0020C40853|nr:IS200/IS605 family transposase [Halomarina sp. BND7]
MPRGYSKERTSVHRLHYYFIWCPKYRKSVLTGEAKDRLEALIGEKADELDSEILALAVRPDHVHLFIEGNPKLAPNKIMQQVKGHSSRRMREEFDFGLPSLWTRSYFVSSAGDVSDETVEAYIEAQTGQRSVPTRST